MVQETNRFTIPQIVSPSKPTRRSNNDSNVVRMMTYSSLFVTVIILIIQIYCIMKIEFLFFIISRLVFNLMIFKFQYRFLFLELILNFKSYLNPIKLQIIRPRF